LFNIQILYHGEYKKIYKNQNTRVLTFSNSNGLLLDKNSLPIGLNINYYDVFLDINSKFRADSILEKILNMRANSIRQLIHETNKKYIYLTTIPSNEMGVHIFNSLGLIVQNRIKREFPISQIFTDTAQKCIQYNFLRPLDYNFRKEIRGNSINVNANIDPKGRIVDFSSFSKNPPKGRNFKVSLDLILSNYLFKYIKDQSFPSNNSLIVNLVEVESNKVINDFIISPEKDSTILNELFIHNYGSFNHTFIPGWVLDYLLELNKNKNISNSKLNNKVLLDSIPSNHRVSARNTNNRKILESLYFGRTLPSDITLQDPGYISIGIDNYTANKNYFLGDNIICNLYQLINLYCHSFFDVSFYPYLNNESRIPKRRLNTTSTENNLLTVSGMYAVNTNRFSEGHFQNTQPVNQYIHLAIGWFELNGKTYTLSYGVINNQKVNNNLCSKYWHKIKDRIIYYLRNQYNPMSLTIKKQNDLYLSLIENYKKCLNTFGEL